MEKFGNLKAIAREIDDLTNNFDSSNLEHFSDSELIDNIQSQLNDWAKELTTLLENTEKQNAETRNLIDTTNLTIIKLKEHFDICNSSEYTESENSTQTPNSVSVGTFDAQEGNENVTDLINSSVSNETSESFTATTAFLLNLSPPRMTPTVSKETPELRKGTELLLKESIAGLLTK